MAKQLPGFYFDEQDKKYHKIQPSHLAPQGSKYTRQAINDREQKALVGLYFALPVTYDTSLSLR